MWNLSEGVRRKLSIANNRRIIGFTISELETLVENNFYTMLQTKYNNLIHEIDDSYIDIDNTLPYNESLYNSVLQLHKLEIINQKTFNQSINNIQAKFGEIESLK